MALNRQKVSNLPLPAWYSPVSGHTSEASIPILWSELVAQELGAATGVYLPPAPYSDSLASRIGSYNSQRGLFVSDLGRLLLRHALLGSSTPEGVVLNLAVTAARKSHRLSKNGPSLSAAERAGGHKGIELLLYTFDRLLFSEDANAARRLWASPAWADTNLSAIGLLNKLSEDANTCSKSDAEVLARWSGAVSDVFYENNKPVTLSMLYNEFANNIDAYPSSMELLLRLRVHAYGDTPLSEMIGGAAPSQPRRHQPRHHHEAAAAAATQPFSLDDEASRAFFEQAADRAIAERVNRLDLSASSAPATSHRPSSSLVSGAAPNTANTFATQSGNKPVIAGFADISKIREAGRFPLIAADSNIPLFDPEADDGRFTLNCPFCGVGAPGCKTTPTRCYSGPKEYEAAHGCKPFDRNARRIEPTERIAHFSPRCIELWFALRRHVEANKGDEWMLTPIPYQAFYSSIPSRRRQ